MGKGKPAIPNAAVLSFPYKPRQALQDNGEENKQY